MDDLFSTSNNEHKRRGDKKGQVVQDLATIIVVPFALAIIFAVVALAFDKTNTEWQNSSVNNESKDIMKDNEAKFTSILDNGFMILFIGLILLGVVGAFLIDSHPVIFIVSLIGIIALVLVGGMLSNSWSDATESGEINTYTNEFTFMPLVMEHMFISGIIIAGIFSVAFFAKIQLGGRR